MRPGVVEVTGVSDSPPVPWKVAIEIDAVGVLPSARGKAVGVHVRQDPQGDATRCPVGFEVPGDGKASAFVTVDAPDDEHPRSARRTQLHPSNGPALDRRSQHERPPEEAGAARCRPHVRRTTGPGGPGRLVVVEVRHRLHPERHRHRQPHQPARRHRLRQRLVLCVLAIGQQARGALGELLPGIGQRQPPRGAVEQPRAQPLFQPADGFRHRGLGQRQLGGGRRKRP